MSGRQLFRTPLAIGLLSGALAGVVKMTAMVVELKEVFESREAILCLASVGTLLAVTFLLALPAYLAGQSARFVAVLGFRIALFVLLLFTLPYYLIERYAHLFLPYFWYVSLGFTAMFALATGVFQGRTLALAYRRGDLSHRAALWGALGSMPIIAVPLGIHFFAYYISGGQNETWPPEAWAGIVMTIVFSWVMQGIAGAWAFVRTKVGA